LTLQSVRGFAYLLLKKLDLKSRNLGLTKSAFSADIRYGDDFLYLH
jgi:hypothetical protein